MDEMNLPDDVNIDCLYQKQGKGTLICSIAEISGQHTNEVGPEVCYECPVGKIYRELGCDKISAKLSILKMLKGNKLLVDNLWCNLRKRKTDYEYCLTCPYMGTQFTKPIMKETKDLFDKLGFEKAKKNLIKAQEKLSEGDPENTITNSISALESTFKTILDFLNITYPSKEKVTSLWQAVKCNLHLGDEIASKHIKQVIGSLTGAISGLGGLRNDLSDAHGDGLISPEVYDSYAELAVNISASICLFVIRRYLELQE